MGLSFLEGTLLLVALKETKRHVQEIYVASSDPNSACLETEAPASKALPGIDSVAVETSLVFKSKCRSKCIRQTNIYIYIHILIKELDHCIGKVHFDIHGGSRSTLYTERVSSRGRSCELADGACTLAQLLTTSLDRPVAIAKASNFEWMAKGYGRHAGLCSGTAAVQNKLNHV